MSLCICPCGASTSASFEKATGTPTSELLKGTCRRERSRVSWPSGLECKLSWVRTTTVRTAPLCCTVCLARRALSIGLIYILRSIHFCRLLFQEVSAPSWRRCLLSVSCFYLLCLVQCILHWCESSRRASVQKLLSRPGTRTGTVGINETRKMSVWCLLLPPLVSLYVYSILAAPLPPPLPTPKPKFNIKYVFLRHTTRPR